MFFFRKPSEGFRFNPSSYTRNRTCNEEEIASIVNACFNCINDVTTAIVEFNKCLDQKRGIQVARELISKLIQENKTDIVSDLFLQLLKNEKRDKILEVFSTLDMSLCKISRTLDWSKLEVSDIDALLTNRARHFPTDQDKKENYLKSIGLIKDKISEPQKKALFEHISLKTEHVLKKEQNSLRSHTYSNQTLSIALFAKLLEQPCIENPRHGETRIRFGMWRMGL